jgi:hypothetical protein
MAERRQASLVIERQEFDGETLASIAKSYAVDVWMISRLADTRPFGAASA